MGVQMADGLNVVLQGKLLLLVRDTIDLFLMVAIEDASPVNGAQGKDSMQDCWFAEARLQEKGGPEIRDEGPWQLDRGAALKPVKVFLFLRAGDEERDACWPGNDRTISRSRRMLARSVRAPPTTPNAIAIADAAGRDTSATSWVTFVTFDLADPNIT